MIEHSQTFGLNKCDIEDLFLMSKNPCVYTNYFSGNERFQNRNFFGIKPTHSN